MDRANLYKRTLSYVFVAICCGSMLACGNRHAEVSSKAPGAMATWGKRAGIFGHNQALRLHDILRDREEGKELRQLRLGVPFAPIENIQEALPAAVAAQPELITLFAGATDLMEGTPVATFEKLLSDTLAALTEKTPAFIVIANLPNLARVPRFAHNAQSNVTELRIRQFNAAIDRQALQYGLAIADLYSASSKMNHGTPPMQGLSERQSPLVMASVQVSVTSRKFDYRAFVQDEGSS